MTQTVSDFKQLITQHRHSQRGLVLEAIFALILVAAMEMAFAFSAGGDHLIYFATGLGSFFLIVALLFVWSVVRFERRQYTSVAFS